MCKIIDVHAHFMPLGFVKTVRENEKYGVKVIKEQTGEKLLLKDGSVHPLTDNFLNFEKRIEFMDENGVEIQFLSIAPRLFFYDYPAEMANEIAMLCNDEIYSIVNRYKGRFIGVGTVPLQDPDLSVKELRRMRNRLGIKAIQISSHVNDKKLSEPEYFAFFEEAAKNGQVIFIHPPIVAGGQFLEQYYLSNVLGNPFNTTVAATNLIFSGLFDKLPGLKICLAHGGGFLPYQIGRMQQAYRVRKEAQASIKRDPLEYVRENIYFDTVIHSEMAIEYLIKNFGANVMLGTDYPYDMGEYDTTKKMQNLGINKNTEKRIISDNARRFLE